MSNNPFAFVAIAALLAACSAAAQNTAVVEQMSAKSTLLGASTAESAALAEAPAPLVEQPAPAFTPAPAAHEAPSAHAVHEYAAISCDVRSRRTANGVLIQARAFADRDIDGEYDLVITKSGGGNSSEINQAGPVSLAAGSAATLGESEISIERGARVRAVLTLRDASGELCRRTFRL